MGNLLALTTMLGLLLGCAGATTQPSPTPESDSIPIANPITDPVAKPDNSQPTHTTFSMRRAGTLTDNRATEVSGLAISSLNDDRLWMINDSGNSPTLMAFSRQGEFQASIKTNTRNRDWEALSSFQLNGSPYLLVADTGDNLTAHAQYTLLIFPEPVIESGVGSDDTAGTASAADGRALKPLATINFVYPDGKHDCEAVTVSAADGAIFLITKGGGPATRGIYTLPLLLDNNQNVLTATRVGTLAPLLQSLGDQLLGNLVGVDLSQATALDINEQSTAAYLLTYRGIYRWTRNPRKQSWGEVMSLAPQRLTRHSLAQAEAMALANNNDSVYVVSEQIPSPILELSPVEDNRVRP